MGKNRKALKDPFLEKVVAANVRSLKRAFEVAVRTKTALVFARNGKIITVKPPYRYELVRIKASKKPRSKKD